MSEDFVRFPSCICESVGEVEQRALRSTVSRLVMIVRLGAKFGI